MPSWLCNPGPILMKLNVRNSKHDPLVDKVELLDANPQYAHVRLPNGKETTVSIKKLAPQGISMPSVDIDVQPTGLSEETNEIILKENYTSESNYSIYPSNHVSEPTLQNNITEGMLQNDISEHAFQNKITKPILQSRRSTCIRKVPIRLDL